MELAPVQAALYSLRKSTHCAPALHTLHKRSVHWWNCRRRTIVKKIKLYSHGGCNWIRCSDSITHTELSANWNIQIQFNLSTLDTCIIKECRSFNISIRLVPAQPVKSSYLVVPDIYAGLPLDWIEIRYLVGHSPVWTIISYNRMESKILHYVLYNMYLYTFYKIQGKVVNIQYASTIM